MSSTRAAHRSRPPRAVGESHRPSGSSRFSRKRISHAHSSWSVMGYVARNDHKIVNWRCRGHLFVEWILGIGDAKAAPNVRSLLVERKYSISVYGCHSQQPLLEPLCLRLVAPMANSLDALPELADRYGRKVKLGALLTGTGKECAHTRVALVSLAGLADYVRVDQIHFRTCGRPARARNPCPYPRSAC